MRYIIKTITTGKGLNIPSSEYLQCFFAIHDHEHAPLNVIIGSHKKDCKLIDWLWKETVMLIFSISIDILKEFQDDFYSVKLKR